MSHKQIQKNIFCAGKIRPPDDWRLSFVDGNAFCSAQSGNYYCGASVLQLGEHFPTLYYAGPFVESDAYYCGVNRAAHADTYTEGKHIYQRCMKNINEADIVFVWLDTADAFGTFGEIGYARGRGKTIWIASNACIETDVRQIDSRDAYPVPRSPWWFLYEMADQLLVDESLTPLKALKLFISKAAYSPALRRRNTAHG